MRYVLLSALLAFSAMNAHAQTLVFDFEELAPTSEPRTGALNGLTLIKEGFELTIKRISASGRFDIVDNSGVQLKPPSFGTRSLDPFFAGNSHFEFTFSKPVTAFSIDFGRYFDGSSDTSIYGYGYTTPQHPQFELAAYLGTRDFSNPNSPSTPASLPAFNGGSFFSYATAAASFVKAGTTVHYDLGDAFFVEDATIRWLNLLSSNGSVFLDNIRLEVAEFDVGPQVTLNSVPLPATAWLFAAAIGVATLFRRRNS